MQSMTIDSAAIRLTDTILGYDEPDLEQALKAIAANIGVLHISYVPLSSEKSEDAKLLSAICTYGLSIPVRNRVGVRSLVSFTSNHSKDGWAEYKSRNMIKLQPMAVLIDSAAGSDFNPRLEPVELSKREEECLIWAARGKTYHDIAGILNLSFASVKTYLDTARHKLSCINLTHAVAVAIATGVIPAKALRQPC